MGINITSKQALPLLIPAVLMAVIAIMLSVWGFIRSFQSAFINAPSNSKYLQITATFSNLFNCVSCICVATYLLWLTIFPLTDEDLFLTHNSIRLRVATTASWYIGKIFLFLIFNGRLYYAFRHSKYRSNYTIFKSLNIFVIIHAMLSLIVGYIGVMNLHNEVIANIGFNTFHINLAILLFYLSIQFNRRMFSLAVSKVKIELSRSHNDPEEIIEFSSITQNEQKAIVNKAIEGNEFEQENNTINCMKEIPSRSDIDDDGCHSHKVHRRHVFREDSVVLNREFLRIVTRSSLLLTIIIPFMISISITWTLHRFAWNTTHFTMCLALLVMCIDSFVDVICVLLLFKYADSAYNVLCKCSYTNVERRKLGCDFCFTQCCIVLAKKNVHD